MIPKTGNKTLSYERKVLLLILYLIGTILAILCALYLRFPREEACAYLIKNLNAFLTYIILSLPALYVWGLFEPKNIQNPTAVLKLSFCSTFSVSILVILIFYSRLMIPLGRGAFLLTAIFTILFLSLITITYGKILPKILYSRRLAFISNDPLHQELIGLITSNPECGYIVHRILLPSSLGALCQEAIDGFVLPTTSISPEISRTLRMSRFSGIEIYDPLFLYGELTGQIPVDYLTEEWLFSAALSHSNFHLYKVKRLLDIVASLVGLFFFLPFFPLIALVIKLDSPGPVLFKQERVGRNGKLFSIYKLRTMINEAEKENRPVWAEEDDPRITRVGKVLRRLRVDEFLQLVNVLRGEMSLIGPRPERRQFVSELARQIPFYEERLLLQPGITGWAQVNYPYASSLEDSKKKLQYDLYYYKNISLWLDLIILLRTVRVVLTASGR